MSIESVMPFNHLVLCCPLLLLLSFFPSIRVFFSELALLISQSIGASASASVLSMNIQDWFSLGLTAWYCKKKIFPLGYNIFLKVGEVCLLLLFFYITSSLCIIDTGVGLSLYLTSMHTPLTLSPSVHTRHIHLHCRAQPASPSASRNQVDLKILADSFIWLWKISQTPQTLAPWAGRKKAGWKRGVLD